MLSLRLARGSRPAVLLRRALVVAAAAGASFLLLYALGFAAGHPTESGGGVARLLWCVVPLAATVHLTVAVARADPGTRPSSGLSAVGLGPARSALLAATGAALSCAAGSALALLTFLHLRGGLGGSWLLWAGSGAAGRELGAGRPLPLAGAITLVALVPVLAGGVCAAVLWPRRTGDGRTAVDARPGATPTVATGAVGPRPDRTASGLPWGVALTAAGLALEAYAGSGAAPRHDALLHLPGRLGETPPGVAGGWALTMAGLVLAGPGLTHRCGWLLSVGRPGALRLLAGRVLQQEAGLIGRPVGVLCVIASAGYAVARLDGTGTDRSGDHLLGPLTVLGAALVVVCAVATTLTAALEARAARRRTTAALLRLGAPSRLLRGAAALRAAALVALLSPLTWAVAHLTTMPVSH
ncbi:hypothetical protein HUT19_11450 [Streptomyces sp. NA02950]|uniref:hypothetical protein n=1 Tax=Streptomyces sp. NA02950 TaxID=2742137 RepID=UPI001591F8CA|nr:hypothetical protein [Streptomyces sp. NA02950]QKV92289.1 hypothetical protein HUT19_11450 [Streptomyces sp. NA02950]